MSRWPGRLISKTPVTPSGPGPTAAAPGVWTIPEMAYWTKQGRWPNASADPYWSYVSYLLGTTSTNAAQNNTFLDSSTNNFTITRVGNTTQGSLTPYGTLWSNYFDGSSYITMASGTAAGTGDFTIEGWFNVASYSTGPGLYDTRPSFTNGAYPAVFVDASGYLTYYVNTATQIQGATLVGINTWNHFAVCRSGTSTRLFLNGVQQGSTYTDTNNYQMGASRPIIGGNGYYPNGASQLTGYVSNIRVVNGTALYTAAFTPPASPLTAISGTVLLTCQGNRFRDASTNNVAVSVTGSARVAPSSPFVLAPPGYDTSVNGGSAYLDGSSYLTAPANSVFAFGTGDFTVECWVNFSPGSAGGRITDRLPGGGASGTWGFNFSPTTFAFTEVVAGEPGVTASGLPNMTSTWTHLAACRSGSTLRLFANGVLVGSGTNTTNFSNSSYALCIGAAYETAITGYLSNVRIVKGTAVYTAAFTPPTTPVTAIANTSLLLNFTNAGIYDASMNNDMETVGNAQVSTGQAKFGTTSAYFDGSGDYLRLLQGQNLSSGNWTIEFWVYFNSFTGTTSPHVFNFGTDSNNRYGVYRSTTGKLSFFTANSGSFDIKDGTTTVAINTWYHVAVVSNAGTRTMYVNGTSEATSTSAINAGTNWVLGFMQFGSASADYLNGYLDDFRVTKGYARYTANFTPPTQAFPPY